MADIKNTNQRVNQKVYGENYDRIDWSDGKETRETTTPSYHGAEARKRIYINRAYTPCIRRCPDSL